MQAYVGREHKPYQYMKGREENSWNIQVLPTQLPSSIFPSLFPPSCLHVSTNPCFGSSSAKPLFLLTANTALRICRVHSSLKATASLPYFNPSLSTPIANPLPSFFSSSATSSRHCRLNSLKIMLPSPPTLSPNQTPQRLLIRGTNLGHSRASCMIWSLPSSHMGIISGHSSGSRIRRAMPHLK